jgi:putative component of membrane protein insertase Oxa1/YidC/SpoIIIJ protein YidD
LKEYGFLKGMYKGVIRLLRCHPIKWLGGSFGYDPIISKRKHHG